MDDTISRQAAIDAMCSVCGHDCDKSEFVYNAPQDEQVIMCPEHYALSTLPSAQPKINNQINLCDSCRHTYPDCPAGEDDVLFGNGAGNDNICACGKYEVSGQTESDWISCSKRVPDDLAEVNITYVNTRPEPYYDFLKGKPFAGTAVYYKGRWYWYSAMCVDYLGEYGFSPNDEMDDYIKVIAWKPLPEPYIGE